MSRRVLRQRDMSFLRNRAHEKVEGVGAMGRLVRYRFSAAVKGGIPASRSLSSSSWETLASKANLFVALGSNVGLLSLEV